MISFTRHPSLVLSSKLGGHCTLELTTGGWRGDLFPPGTHSDATPTPTPTPSTEITVVFGNPPSMNNNLGCANMYRVELMDGNNAIMKENVQATPMQGEVSFVRKLNPGRTYA